MGQKLFTSGEFAKFCNTTKDTLFHYDDINLLKPAKIAPNGYRYYSANQAFLFDMISLLKEVGLSLEEIKIYMDNRDAKTFLSMLKEKDKKIHQEIERLKRLRSLLKNTMNITLDSFNVEIDKITCSIQNYISSIRILYHSCSKMQPLFRKILCGINISLP